MHIFATIFPSPIPFFFLFPVFFFVKDVSGASEDVLSSFQDVF